MGKDVAVLDIGSCKLVFAVGHKTSTGVYAINSFSCVPYMGYYNSEFCNVSTLKDDIKKAVDSSKIQKLQKCLYIGVPAEFSKIETNTYLMNFGRERLISNSLINNIHSRGDQYSSDVDWEVFSSAAINYVLDECKTVINPYGERARSIKATISYMLVKKEFVKLLDAIALEIGFSETKYVSSCWAIGNRFIDENNRRLSALSLDVGFGSSSLSIMKGDGIVKLANAPLGTGSIYNKLSLQLGVDFSEALKLEDSINLNFVAADGALYTVVSDNKVKTYRATDVNNAVMTRLDEIVEFVNTTISAEPGLVSDTTPVYLTGGGISGLKGAILYLEQQLKRRVRVLIVEVPNYNKPYYTSMFALLDVAYEINENLSIWNKIF